MYTIPTLASLSYGSHGKSIADQIDRDQFEREGYFIVNDILAKDEINGAVALIDQLLPPDAQPPYVCGTGAEMNGRKALRGEHCEPRLSNLAGHPRLVEAAEMLMGSGVRICHTSCPVVTYKSPPGAEQFGTSDHVDWPHTPPEPGDETYVNCVLHFSTVEPGGGAFIVRPGSHRFVQECLDDPELREQVVAQGFKEMDGLQERRAMCVPAGSAVFSHAFMVHDRSENVLEAPRRVLFAHFARRETDEPVEDRSSAFHPDQVRSMDDRMKRLCGIPEG
ncbi:MAG: phytanoyl-CoA dioxygenase family protein [Candidatus Poribacteria bacterium]|nr:phytanoyl-CoA dioxygenase family protein [Candidatus Poribacteria bacterium]MDE0506241.1 phytanoyl-CoA dioxygenase family protein [Candidatus Poribacteria bacterium]